MSRASRSRVATLLAAAALALGPIAVVGTSLPASAGAAPSPRSPASSPDAPLGGTLEVGSLTLHRCDVVVGAYCGSIRRPWDPSGDEPGTVRVGFAFLPARDHSQPAKGTLVPHEGGPGYSTTGSGPEYAHMYEPLLTHRNLLLVDQRGTGLSDPIDCPELQRLTEAYSVAAGQCGRSLGRRADNYTTAESADDVAAVIEKLQLAPVDVYGDSYGTFFTEVFVGRHPGLVRSVVLDSAYPTYGETAWYPTQTAAMRSSFVSVCRQSPVCAQAPGSPMTVLHNVLVQVRQHPWQGWTHDADGRRMQVKVDGSTLAAVAFSATYGPPFYRELTAALRSALVGYKAPLFRLVGQATGGGLGAGRPAAYSEGLDAAVSCHDYPQLYDMTAPPQQRLSEYAHAVATEEHTHPGLFRPFTIGEYLSSDWEEQDWCTRWPVAGSDNPAGPPKPPGGVYPPVPTLILSGALDSITTPAEGRMVELQFPNSRQVVFANSFHVTAMGDTDGCAVRILWKFVAHPATGLSPGVLRCAKAIPPYRALGVFPRQLVDVTPAHNIGRSEAGLRQRRAASAAAQTVADMLDTWFDNYSGHGVGLLGGTFAYTGNRVTTFQLHDLRFAGGLGVSGSVVWDRYGNALTANLTVAGNGISGSLHGGWQTRTEGAHAHLLGSFGDRQVNLWMPAP